MARRRQRDAFGRASFDRRERMTEAAFGAFERHSAADILLHFRLMTRDATGRGRLLAHRFSELVEEVRAGDSGLAGLVADQTTLRALAEAFAFGVVVVGHVSFVVERRGRLGLRPCLLRRFGRIELGVDNLAVEPEHGQFRTHPFLFLFQVVTANAVGRKGRRLLIHLLFVEVTDEALLVAGHALFDAFCELHAADCDRLPVLIVAGGALEVVLLFEFALVLEYLFERL